MAEIIVIEAQRTNRLYRKVLAAAGHNVHHLGYDDLSELGELAKKDYFHADVIILVAKREHDIEELVSSIRTEYLMSNIPLVVLGRDINPDIVMRHNIFTLPQVKGSLLVSILQKFVLSEGQNFNEPENSQVERIIRSIEFPPEYYQSGITILSYFASILRQKNLSDNVKVSIEQSDLVVRLIIESPTGQRELIERTLDTYTLVVMGKRSIDELTTDPFEMMELKSQLRIAYIQLQNQRDLLDLSKSEIAQLRDGLAETRTALMASERRAEAETNRFMSLLEGLITNNADLSSGFRKLAEQAASLQNSTLTDALEGLHTLIKRGLREDDKEEFIQKMEIIRQEDSSVFRQVSDILIKGAISGAAGNYLYSWLQFIIGSLPK